MYRFESDFLPVGAYKTLKPKIWIFFIQITAQLLK